MREKGLNLEKVILIVMFAVIFIANCLSPLCIDDFGYAFSRATDERITNIVQLISSVKAFSANGRYLACFVIQFSLIFPKVIFNIVNSVVFIIQIVLLRRLCCTDGKKSWKMAVGIIGLIWCFIPAFGEDYLWLCAAILYSWGATLSLLYTCHFSKYMHSMEEYSVIRQIVLCATAFFLGAYAETTAAVAVMVPVLYYIAIRFIKKKKVRLWMGLSEICACCGLLFLLTRPAERIKILQPSFLGYLTRLYVLIIKYIEAFGILLLLFFIFIMFVFIKMKTSNKNYSLERFTDSVIYMLLSLGINCVLIFAPFYPSRVMLLTGLFLFLSVLSFIYEAKEIIQYEKLCWRLLFIVYGVAAIGVITYGMYDICLYSEKIDAMYAEIQKQVEEGKTKIILSECPDEKSKYINYNECAYFDTDPESYVNEYFMRYMGYEGTIQVKEKDSN